MKFLECDLEEIIYTADRKLLEDRGLKVSGRIHRQLRIGNYGVADLITFCPPSWKEKNNFEPALITVYELKKDKIGISAFLQAIGYAKGIQHYLKLREVNFKFIIRIVLIGSKIDLDSTFCYMSDLIPENFYGSFLETYQYEYKIDGIQFDCRSFYTRNNPGFNIDDDLPF